MRLILLAGAALLAAGCSEEPQANAAAAAAAKLTPGQYEVTAIISAFRSTDGATPIVRAKQGETSTSRACVPADGSFPPELLAARGDACTAENAYVRNGRMNLTLSCKRAGTSGNIMTEANGSFTADTIKGSATTITSLSGSGDYQLTQDFTGRRVGDCTAPGAAS